MKAHIKNEIPNWIPNWRFSNEYPTKLDSDGWAWEFLRRNKEYQLDFSKKFNQAKRELEENIHNLDSKELKLFKDNLEDPKIFFHPFENWNKWIAESKEKWGLDFYLNPSTTHGYYGFSGKPRIVFSPNYPNNTKENYMQVPNNYAGVLINLTKPISGQISAISKRIQYIKRSFKIENKTTGSANRGKHKFIEYLRIIDALNFYHEDASAIKKVLYDNKRFDYSKINNLFHEDRNSALKILGGSYLNIASLF